jgi:hypothetical protein
MRAWNRQIPYLLRSCTRSENKHQSIVACTYNLRAILKTWPKYTGYKTRAETKMENLLLQDQYRNEEQMSLRQEFVSVELDSFKLIG